MTEHQAARIIELADKHAGSNGSACLCLEDARRLLGKGLYLFAENRAITSLQHSVGIFHEDYKQAIAIQGE